MQLHTSILQFWISYIYIKPVKAPHMLGWAKLIFWHTINIVKQVYHDYHQTFKLPLKVSKHSKIYHTYVVGVQLLSLTII